MTIIRAFAAGSVLFIASTALALDLSKTTLPYADVSPTSPYALPISMLTSEGVLQGYPDGTFRPTRTLNRAEFLKIILESAPPLEGVLQESEGWRCFPDMPKDAWFSRYVCLAKDLGVVQGYPDGSFRPEKNVNYVEALKMLVEVYHYPLTRLAGDTWYDPYLRAAQERDTALSDPLAPDAPLSRGQMSQLAAQFLAELAGELDAYREAEAKPTEAQPDTGEGEEERVYRKPLEGNKQEVSTRSLIPRAGGRSQRLPVSIRSHFLLLGTDALPIASVKVKPEEPVEVRTVTVTMTAAVPSLDMLEITDNLGAVLGTARLLSGSTTAFGFTLSPAHPYILEKGQQVLLLVRPRIKESDAGGTTGEIVQVSAIEITAFGSWTQETSILTTTDPVFPPHQTALTSIQSIIRNGSDSRPFKWGSGILLGAFDFFAPVLSSTEPALTSLTFTLHATGTTLSTITIRGNGSTTSSTCSGAATSITCNNLPNDVGSLIGTRTLSVYANVALTTDPEHSIELELLEPGSPTTAGAISWTDGSALFNWVELDRPIATGTLWR